MPESTAVVHVDVALLDRLLNLVGELAINRAALFDLGKQARAKHGFKETVLRLTETTEQLARFSKDIQNSVLKARMVPIERVFNRFRNMLDDIKRQTNRELMLFVRGESTEVDRKIADDLSEPLVHLLRNAADHGIEPSAERLKLGKDPCGTIVLDAFHDSNHLVIEVRDDGAGLNVEAIREKAIARGVVGAEEGRLLEEKEVIELLFRTGFSTRDQVTSLSGRGVGMDAAKQRVESIGGTLTLESAPGRGTCARIRVPLTLAIIPALIVRVGEEHYAIPLENVQETVRAWHHEVRTVEGREVLPLRGEPLRLAHTRNLLDVEGNIDSRRRLIVVVRYKGRRLGLVVDRVVGRQEIVIKPVPPRLAHIHCLSGASIATNGSVFLILDVVGLCEGMRDA